MTSRGKKHLTHLQKAIEKGYQTYLLFLIQREDVKIMKIASDIDMDYYNEIKKAKKMVLKLLHTLVKSKITKYQ